MKMATLLLTVGLALFALPTFAVPPTGVIFTPQAGFGGVSEGNGTLKLLFGKPRPYHVDSAGHVLADGTFRLDQTVLFQGESPRHRHWILRTVSPGKFAGTLSDAAGAVTGHTEGRRLLLRYRLNGPLVMHQALEIMSDGTIDNVGSITLLGIPVGHLQETILKKSAVDEQTSRQQQKVVSGHSVGACSADGVLSPAPVRMLFPERHAALVRGSVQRNA